jgi:hypothetical protein
MKLRLRDYLESALRNPRAEKLVDIDKRVESVRPLAWHSMAYKGRGPADFRRPW